MRVPKPEWIIALRELCGPESNIRFNDELSRWEFLIPDATGEPKSQFWGWFDQPAEDSGLMPFRELDDDGMRLALHNLSKTFIGTTDTQGVVLSRLQHNYDHAKKLRRSRGTDFANWIHENRRQIIKGYQGAGHDFGPPKKTDSGLVVAGGGGKGSRKD